MSLKRLALQDCHQSALHNGACFILQPALAAAGDADGSDDDDLIQVSVKVFEVRVRLPLQLLAVLSVVIRSMAG